MTGSLMRWMFVVLLLALNPLPINADQPNIMIILADDLGFSDLGCYGGEIDTPNLDQLAVNGLRFTNFYNTGRCWPTRSSILTGYYPQQVRRDKIPGIKPGGMGGRRPEWAPLAPVRMKKAGYRTYHIGKWHIDGMPIQQGFDHSYFLGDQARFFSPKRRFLNDKALPEIERGSGYYATVDLADRSIAGLKEHQQNHPDEPFFFYLALTAPHFPLHALPQDIEKYSARYLKGWDAARQARWEKIQQQGILSATSCGLSEIEQQTGAPYQRPKDIKAYGEGEVPFPKPWSELNAQQQSFQATKMAIHAAMVDRIDQEVGRVIDQLKAMNQFENTLILFLSDNGCSSELMIRDDGHDPSAAPGSAATHLCLGPGWSTASNTPFRKHKTWVHEGGISTPLIAHWPAGIPDRGTVRNQPAHLVDVLPTIMELAGSELMPDQGGPAFPGRSLVNTIRENTPPTEHYQWWSHENNNAIRIGNWKAVQTSSQPWELYDLSKDRSETNNLAAANPQRLEQLTKRWNELKDEFARDAGYLKNQPE